MELKEVRVFSDLFEMQEDYDKFCKEKADQYHSRDQTACYRDGNDVRWRVYWVHYSRMIDRIYGMSINRIHMDVECSKEHMKYAMSRLRSPHGDIEPLHVFYRRVE